MAGVSNWALVSSIQSEIQREQNNLKYVDENLKRLTGRDFNEPRGERRIRIVSGTREDEPQPKPRYPKGVFARLGAPVLEATTEPRMRRVREVSEIEEDGEPPKKKPLVASSVARPPFDGKTRTEAAAELTKDRASRDRNRRMFGSLLGTLQRFKTEEAKLKDKDDKRAKVEKKLEEKGRAEKELLVKERIELINQRKERQARIQRLNIKMARVKEHEAWEKYQKQLQKFIRTKSTPKIFWLPKIPSSRCSQLILNTKESIEKELEEERLRLKKELDQLLGERFNAEEEEEIEGEEEDEEEEEVYGEEGLGRDHRKPSFREGLVETHHFSNGSSVNNFENEEGELVNEEGELWLSGKKRQNSERFVIQVDSVSKEPTRRVEIVSIPAPNVRRVKEERVDKNARVKERIQMESEKENLVNGKRKGLDKNGKISSLIVTESDRGKDKVREKERRKKQKGRNKEKEKLKPVMRDSSQQGNLLDGLEELFHENGNEENFTGKDSDFAVEKEALKSSEKSSKKSRSREKNDDRNIFSEEEGELTDDNEEVDLVLNTKSAYEIERNRTSDDEKRTPPPKVNLNLEEKEKRLTQKEVTDPTENKKKGLQMDGKDAADRERRSSLKAGSEIHAKEKRKSLIDGKDNPEKDSGVSKKDNIDISAKEKTLVMIDDKDTTGKGRRISLKESDVIEKEKRRSLIENREIAEKEKRQSLKERKDSTERERKLSQKEGKDTVEKEKRYSTKEGRITSEKEKNQFHKDGKDTSGSEKSKRQSENFKYPSEKEKRQSLRSVKESSKREKNSLKDDKGKGRKHKAVKESSDIEEMEGEEIWSEDLSHISLPLEPEPAVTEVVVQRVPISEDGQENEDDEQGEMQVESVLIPVSQIKKDKSVWEPQPFHRPIMIKKEKDPSPVAEKKEKENKSDSDSSSDSGSEESSSESGSSGGDPSSSNSSDSSSDDEKHEKKKKVVKLKRKDVKETRAIREKGRHVTKRKGESSSSSSEDSSSSSSSDSDDSSSGEEKNDKRVGSSRDKKTSSKSPRKGKVTNSKDSSSKEKDKIRKSSKSLDKKEEQLKKIMEEEADRLRARIIRGVERKSKSREKGRVDKRSRSRERQRERSKESKKARK